MEKPEVGSRCRILTVAGAKDPEPFAGIVLDLEVVAHRDQFRIPLPPFTEARLCRWLLQSADRAASDTVALTQELLAEMLGVRRTSVTETASKIQASGAISYSRGVIKIIDRPALEALACECYRMLLNHQAELV